MKSILISGCSTGIGEHCALLLKNKGWRVFAGARQPADIARLKQSGLEAIALDVDSSESIAQALDYVLTTTGGSIDALFNNAGFGQTGAVEDLSREAMRRQFETNLFGALELTNLIIPVMRKQKHGRLIFNSSMLGIVSLKYRGAYNASKFAMEGLVDTLRLELAATNLKVSLIEPGPVISQFRHNALVKFRENIDDQNSIHAASYEKMIANFKTEGAVMPFTLGPEAVGKKLLHALESKRPKAHYPVTVPAHLSFWLRRLLPTRVLDSIAGKI